jgi:hypothetical protein
VSIPPLPGWYALVGPAKMDPKIGSVNKFLADAAVQAKLRGLFVEPIPGTPEAARSAARRRRRSGDR